MMAVDVDQQLRAIFTQAPDAIITTDADGLVTAWNPAAERITGWASAEVIGTPASDYRTTLDGWHYTKDGRRYWSSGTTLPLRDASHEICGFVEMFRDATCAREESAAAQFRAQLSDAVRRESDPETFTRTARAMLGRHLDVNRVFFAELDLDTNESTIRDDWTNGLPSIVGIHRLRDYSDLETPELVAGKAFVFSDADRDFPAGAQRDAVRAIGAIASIAMPSVVDDRLVSLAVVHQSRPRQWTDCEISLLRHVADIVAVELRRARTAAALRRSETELRQLADGLPQMVWAAQPGGTVDYYNRRWYDYTGLPEGGIGRESWEPAIHPDDVGPAFEMWKQTLRETGDCHSAECRYRRASDGAYRWHLVRAVPVRNADGNVIRWFATSTDIHDQKLAFELYRENREQLALAIEAGAMGTWHMDLVTHETTHSDAAKAFYGLGPGDSLSMTDCVRAVHPEDRAIVKSAYRHALETGHYAAEYRLVRRDGTVRWTAVYGRVIRAADGQARSFTGIMHDTTERRVAEKRREELLVVEQAAREEAERAGRMKDEFLATLSHELRTPLNAIVGWSSVLERLPGSSMSPELANGIEIIARNARMQSQIIEDALDMSRIVSGNLRLDIKVVDVHAVARAAIETVKAAANAKGIGLSVVLDSSAGAIAGDTGRLQQVLWNLLSNAVKFTPQGGRMELTVERRGSHIELRVADNGEGIAEDFLPFAFDRFRQADGSTTRRHGGLGLGLAIVKQLVELHGGTVSVTSPGAGMGATFIVSLPLTPAHAAREPRPSAAAPSGLALREVNVVLVDDEPDGRAAVSHLLASEGANVRTASSAEEALALFASATPDVLISDLGMPDEDGYSLIRRIRGLPEARGGSVPAAALTAFAHEADRARALDAGFQVHLAKPVDPAALVATVVALSKASARAIAS